MAQLKLKAIQRGLESTSGTEVNATFKHIGPGTLKFDTVVATPELDYATGVLGGNVEGAYIAEDGATIVLPDYPFSHEDMVWLANHAIKAVVGPATTFAFTAGTTAQNTLRTFTYEVNTATSNAAYTMTYGFCEKFSVHGDAGANNGRLYTNATIRTRAAVAQAGTAALGFLANMEYATVYQTTMHLDSLGTAAGTAAATANVLKAFSIDWDTGNRPGPYADGRATKDFSIIDQGDYSIGVKLRLALSATTVTRLSNMRAGTAEVLQLKVTGTSSRITKFNVPVVWTEVGEVGEDEVNGLLLYEFMGKSSYSRTSVAQGPEVNVTLSASTTVT